MAFHLSPIFSSEYLQGLPSCRTRKTGDGSLKGRQPARRPQNQRGKIKAKPSFQEHFKERAQNGPVVVAIAGAGVNTLSCPPQRETLMRNFSSFETIAGFRLPLPVQ